MDSQALGSLQTSVFGPTVAGAHPQNALSEALKQVCKARPPGPAQLWPVGTPAWETGNARGVGKLGGVRKALLAMVASWAALQSEASATGTVTPDLSYSSSSSTSAICMIAFTVERQNMGKHLCVLLSMDPSLLHISTAQTKIAALLET